MTRDQKDSDEAALESLAKRLLTTPPKPREVKPSPKGRRKRKQGGRTAKQDRPAKQSG